MDSLSKINTLESDKNILQQKIMELNNQNYQFKQKENEYLDKIKELEKQLKETKKIKSDEKKIIVSIINYIKLNQLQKIKEKKKKLFKMKMEII